MSERDLARADTMVAAFTELSPIEQYALMRLLAIYDDASEFTEWANRVGIEPNDTALARYDDVHYLFARLWAKLGCVAFFEKLRAARLSAIEQGTFRQRMLTSGAR